MSSGERSLETPPALEGDLGGDRAYLIADGGSAGRSEVAGDHRVQFYDDDDFLTAAAATFLLDGLKAGESLLAIATEPHRNALTERLASQGVDLQAALDSGHLTLLDAHAALAGFLREGQPDPELFKAQIGTLVAQRARTGRVRAYGEMVDVLWRDGEKRAALRLEGLWNDLQKEHPFTLLCAYAMASFYKEPAELQRVCASHAHVVGDAPKADGSPAEASGEALYSQRLSLEIAQREQVEKALRESLRELEVKDEALRRSEQQLRDFVENAPVGMHRIGADGVVLWANRAELRMLGYTEPEYVGQPIVDFHVDQPVIHDILARLERGEELEDVEARLRAKDGSTRRVSISSNVYYQNGRFVHTRCFTQDVTERRRAEEALRASDVQLELITDTLPVLVSFVDAGGSYRFVNATYERWFGQPRSAIVGKRLIDVLGAAAFETIRPHVEAALAGEAVTFESRVAYRGGGLRWVHASYVPQRTETGEIAGFVALVHDVTNQKELESARTAAGERSERLLKITAALASAVTETQVFEAIVDHVADAVGASTAALWLIDPGGVTAKLMRSIGYRDGARQKLSELPLDLSPSLPAVDSLRRGEALWIPSQKELLERYPHLRPMVSEGRGYRVACLPLVARDAVIGALALTIEEELDASAEERGFLLLVARYASQAVERLRLLEEEQRSRADADAAAARMRLLSRASQTFAEADLGLDSQLDLVVREIGTILESCVGLALLQPDGALRSATVYHPVPEAQELLTATVEAAPPRLGEGIVGVVASTGKSVLIPSTDPANIQFRSAAQYRTFLERYPFHALICVPLRARGRVIGTATATRTRAGESYSQADLLLLEELAERAATAIEKSRLHQENLLARSRAEELYRFAHSIVNAETVEDVFETALAGIQSTLGTARAAVLLYDSGGVMRFRAWRNLSDEYRAAVEGHSPWPRDAVAPTPVVVTDVRADDSLRPYLSLFEREGIGSLAFIPLVTRGKLLGKFMVYYPAPHDYSGHELEVAVALANHFASVAARFEALSTLRETVRYSELFAGVLAHDLRTPLSAIITAAQLVLMWQEGEGDRSSKPLGRIVTSGQRMNRMIDQLLDLTRARVGGGIEVQPREANLFDLCSQTIEELELAFPEWNIRCEKYGDLRGSWDSDRLLQILSNLIANACQHGEAATGIRVVLDGRQVDAVFVEVHNGGVIPAAMLPSLFDPFRGTVHRRDQSRGLGLGLYIVSEIVRAHGGDIQVRSEEDGGTSFVVTLPRHARSRAPQAPPAPDVSGPQEQRDSHV